MEKLTGLHFFDIKGKIARLEKDENGNSIVDLI